MPYWSVLSFLDIEHSSEICNSCSDCPSMNLAFNILLSSLKEKEKEQEEEGKKITQKRKSG